jgi:hypothetical protein
MLQNFLDDQLAQDGGIGIMSKKINVLAKNNDFCITSTLYITTSKV